MIIYIVQPGDSLSIIANRFNVTIQDIIDNNWVGNDMMIVPGQILFIPRHHHHTHGTIDTADPLSALHPYIRQQVLYVVQRGDTLSAIARRFDSTVEAIAEANHFEGPNVPIYPGQILRIPIIGFR
ncbi:LysM peptidoglycan-binding domain-containing protein [Tepidanaerobacter sp. GT38]|uniref:LysM peptidoglycan-binding domain-containing protein n=1 Tax=Tepidanaerobacter sp. GT38 TaxID=2722793 RepID=UPI001F2539DA|nr:LysM peptidoglycan-binding domain-containing protein [Tepidanaerobacter sp. GT38]MCG1011255.1 LysM peptidoglycan-binding domain-containing protein [Tepidanaerobacter sp. GT38]